MTFASDLLLTEAISPRMANQIASSYEQRVAKDSQNTATAKATLQHLPPLIQHPADPPQQSPPSQ